MIVFKLVLQTVSSGGRGSRTATAVAVAFMLLAGRAAAADDREHLPLPRFVSLKHGESNLRVGPGRRYPVEWVYHRRDLPVEIVSEFDIWRKIRDWQGTEGWVIEQAVSGNRSFIVTGGVRPLYADAGEGARIQANLEAGVIGKLLQCPQKEPDWCRVEVAGMRGWLRRDTFWGVYPREFFQ